MSQLLLFEPGVAPAEESPFPRTEETWIQTRTGRKFHPLNARVEDVDINDIAHALSNMCRYNGHTRSFYSVAQHSVIVSQALPYELRLDGLLHDATEAYLPDVPRPVKPFLTNFKDIEDRLMRVIAKKFGVGFPFHPLIKWADNVALHTERRDLMATPPAPWTDQDKYPPLSRKIEPLYPREAKQLFLSVFDTLSFDK